MIQISLTYPPSANRLWRNVKGRTLKSADYRAWLSANEGRNGGQTIPGRYRMVVQAVAPDKRRRDLDNLLKPISDCLQHIGAVTDDANMRRLEASWEAGPTPGVTVWIIPEAA